jgi:hypothetical protein
MKHHLVFHTKHVVLEWIEDCGLLCQLLYSESDIQVGFIQNCLCYIVKLLVPVKVKRRELTLFHPRSQQQSQQQ